MMPTSLPKACCLHLPIPVHHFPSRVSPLTLLHELSLILAILYPYCLNLFKTDFKPGCLAYNPAMAFQTKG